MIRLISIGLLIVFFSPSTQASEPRKSVEEEAKPAVVTVLVEHRLLPDRIDEAKSEIMQLVRTVLGEEPDCLGIEVFQNVDDPTRITLVEKWTSREAYEGPHMETEHLQSFIARAKYNIAGPPDISFWLGQDAL